MAEAVHHKLDFVEITLGRNARRRRIAVMAWPLRILISYEVTRDMEVELGIDLREI